MSHFVSIPFSTAYTNQSALVKALTEIGFKNVESHAEPINIRDYYQVRNKTAASIQKAEIVIPFEENYISSDAGFTKNLAGEFELVADSMNRGSLKEKMASLPQAYAAASSEEILATITSSAKQAKKGKPIIEKKTLPNDEIQVSVAWTNEIAQVNQASQLQQY